MSSFTLKADKELHIFPGIRLRYVEDVFVVFSSKKLNVINFVSQLKQRFPIKFALQIENKRRTTIFR